MNDNTVAVIDTLIANALDSVSLENKFMDNIKHLTITELRELPDLFEARLAKHLDGKPHNSDGARAYVYDRIEEAHKVVASDTEVAYGVE